MSLHEMSSMGVAQRAPPVKVTKIQVAGARGRFILPGGQMVPVLKDQPDGSVDACLVNEQVTK